VTARFCAAVLIALVALAPPALAQSGGAKAQKQPPAASAPKENPGPPPGRLIDRTKFDPMNQIAMASEQGNELRTLRAAGLRTVRAPELVAYLNTIVDRLLSKSRVPHVPVRLVIAAEDEPNAECGPNGTIKIKLGLIWAVQNEDEIAFILAHEMSHILLRHHDRNWGDQARHYLMQGAVAAQDSMKVISSFKGQGQPQSQTADRAVLAYTGVDLAAGLAVAAYTREQEDEADLLGIDLLIAAGYNAAAANQVIARLPEFEPRPAPRQAQPHRPAPTPNASDGFGKFIGAMVQSMGDTISGGIAQLQADTARKHRTHDERQTYVAEYLSREYPKRTRPAMSAETLQAALAKPATKTVLDQHAAAFAAMAKLKARDVAGAEKLAAEGLFNGGDKQVEPALTMARVRLTRGDRAGALGVLETVARDGEPALPVATARAWVQESSGKAAEAARLLEAANKEFADPPLVMPQLIRVYRKLGRKNDADSLVLKCRYSYPELAERCAAGT
jgi:predicted Zn-dependent protease